MKSDRFNLPLKKLKLRQLEEKVEVFDVLRKKWLVLTPEEEVRQQFVHYLMDEKNYPAGLLAVEYSLKVNSLKRRADVVAFNRFGHPLLLVECKAPSVKIDQKVFDQIARYNLSMKVDFLVVTNGLEHFCCQLDFQNQKYHFLQDIPFYEEIV